MKMDLHENQEYTFSAKIREENYFKLIERKYFHLPPSTIIGLLHDCVMEIVKEEPDKIADEIKKRLEVGNSENLKVVITRLSKEELQRVIRFCNIAKITRSQLINYCASCIFKEGQK